MILHPSRLDISGQRTECGPSLGWHLSKFGLPRSSRSRKQSRTVETDAVRHRFTRSSLSHRFSELYTV